jgi:hypothetical protein
MGILLFLTLAVAQPATHDAFSVRTDLQGLYDEISQTTLQFETPDDVDALHDVLYTSDWTFTDSSGQRHDWAEVRQQSIQRLVDDRPEWITATIQKVSLTPTGASVVVNVTTARTILDEAGQYGRKGASHTITETTVFRDEWTETGPNWRWTARQQLGQPKVVVDRLLSQ